MSILNILNKQRSMNISEEMARLKSRLDEIAEQEQANQQEQSTINDRIAELDAEIKKLNNRRNELDQEALQLYAQAEELQPKYQKLQRIANLSQEFLDLHQECQDNQDLLNTLYSSISDLGVPKTAETSSTTNQNATNKKEKEKTKSSPKEPEENNDNAANYRITIDDIKKALPNAEKIYQNLVASYLEEYQTYQNYILDGLDLIWYSVAFIAFGRSSYRKMSFKYHPDIKLGSERAMQLINTAWEISQQHVNNNSSQEQESGTL